MTTITQFLNSAVTHFAGCYLVSEAPDAKAMRPHAYYLLKRQDQWQLRFLRDGELVKIPETEFTRHPGLDSLQAELHKLPASALGVESKEEPDSVKQILKNYHQSSRLIMTNKVKESLVNADHGFLSRIFSDLPHHYLRLKELSTQMAQYLKCVASMSEEYKALKLDDDAFMMRDKQAKSSRKYQQAEAALATWVDAIVLRGQQELFTRYGNVKPEIAYLLTSVLPVDKSLNQVMDQFEQDTVKQGLLRAYVALVMQEIVRAVPENIIGSIPHVVALDISRQIKARTMYQPPMNVSTALTLLAPTTTSEESKPDPAKINEGKQAIFDFLHQISLKLQHVCQLLETEIREKMKGAKQEAKDFHFEDKTLLALQAQKVLTPYAVDCYRTCRDLILSLSGVSYRQNTDFNYATLMSEFRTCYMQLIDLPAVPVTSRSLFKPTVSEASGSPIDKAIHAVLSEFSEAGLLRHLENFQRVRTPTPNSK